MMLGLTQNFSLFLFPDYDILGRQTTGCYGEI